MFNLGRIRIILQKYKGRQDPLFLFCVIAGLCLFVLGIFLSGRIGILNKKNMQDTAALNQVLPGFNEQSVEELEQEVKDLKLELVDLFGAFDPKESRIKKDYDLTIYFVEELGRASDFLKLKAQGKDVNYPNLGFTQKLPSQEEANYLLSQLYGLKEVLSLGMDYGINFTLVNPGVGPAEELEGMLGMKLVKSRLDLVAPAQSSLIEFIIDLTQTVPVVSLDSILLNLQDSSFKINLTLGHIVIPSTAAEILSPFTLTQDNQGRVNAVAKGVSVQEGNFIHILRSNNPFFVAPPKEKAAAPMAGAPDEARPLSRFFYRGKAILKGREVMVIEDALNKEVRFAAVGESIGGYILVNAGGDRIILKKADTEEEIILERER